jgi:hypothetical protein
MKCRLMARSLPIVAFCATPRNPGVSARLRVLAQRAQATKHGQIVGVNGNTKMELFMCAAHDYFLFSLREFGSYPKMSSTSMKGSLVDL